MKTRTASAYSQQGLSSIAWLLILAAGGFFMTCAFKLIPAYAENRYITEALRSLVDGAKPIGEMSRRDVKSSLQKFYMLNNVRSEGASNIKVERHKSGFYVNINYEERIPLFYNIDVLLSFENQLDSSNPHDCCKPKKLATKKK